MRMKSHTQEIYRTTWLKIKSRAELASHLASFRLPEIKQKLGTTIGQDSFLRSPPVSRVGLPNPVALNEAPQGEVWVEFTV